MITTSAKDQVQHDLEQQQQIQQITQDKVDVLISSIQTNEPKHVSFEDNRRNIPRYIEEEEVVVVAQEHDQFIKPTSFLNLVDKQKDIDDKTDNDPFVIPNIDYNVAITSQVNDTDDDIAICNKYIDVESFLQQQQEEEDERINIKSDQIDIDQESLLLKTFDDYIEEQDVVNY